MSTLKQSIVTFVVLLTSVSAVAQTAEDTDREELRDAWRRYTELTDQGNYKASLIEARRVFELSQTLYPEGDEQIAAATFNYGNNLLRVHHLDDSLRILKIAMKRFERLYGKNAPETIPVLLSMAGASATPPKFSPNQRYLRRALKIATKNFDSSSIEYADQIMLIVAASDWESPSLATVKHIQNAYDVYRDELGSSAIKTGEAAFMLGQYHAKREELDIAEVFLQKALEIFDPSDSARRDVHINIRTFAVMMYEWRGMRDKATKHCVAIGKLLESNPNVEMLPLVRSAPRYPTSALIAGHTGYVDLRFTVDERGIVTEPEVIEFTGTGEFQDAAIVALMKFRYAPRFVDGEAVAVPGVTTKITFDIR